MQSHFSKQNKKKLSHIKWFCRWAVGAGLFVLILFRFCFRPPSIRRQILCLNLNGKFTTILIFFFFLFCRFAQLFWPKLGTGWCFYCYIYFYPWHYTEPHTPDTQWMMHGGKYMISFIVVFMFGWIWNTNFRIDAIKLNNNIDIIQLFAFRKQF